MADQDQFSDLDILPSIKSRELEFIGINACCPGDNGRSRSRILHWIAVPVTIPIKTLNPKSILEFPMIPVSVVIGIGTCYIKVDDNVWNPKVGVLHSLKESLLRIVLVHPNVSCNFVDIESEDDLLCTRVSPPPLPLLSSGFGFI
ncbi:hypothetical protein KY284_014407 [Solanum tuberosum]|nr:hypothetical protein KY284_014407 [Solanum tuberosum]